VLRRQRIKVRGCSAHQPFPIDHFPHPLYQRTTTAPTIHYRIPTVQPIPTAGQNKDVAALRWLSCFACLPAVWAGFGSARWCRVKDVNVRSWLGDEYRRLRGDGAAITRKESYAILQEALRNYARWVNRAAGVEVWLPESHLGNLC